MLYKAEAREVIEVVAPRGEMSEERLRELAAMQGGQLGANQPIESVVVVFVGGAAEAEPHLASIKRYGLACRAIVEGAEQTLVAGSRVQRTREKPEGTLYPVLREESWPHTATVVHRRLLSGSSELGGPWVTYGFDAPKTLARFAPKDLGDRSIAQVEVEALRNLLARNFVPQQLRDGVVVVPGEYCSEAILVPEIMHACADLLGDAQLMVVAVPKESRLMAVDAANLAGVRELVAWTRSMFDGAEGRRISPRPFLVDARGEVVGLATVGDARPREAANKPWYKFW